jgi:uncharacterized paraquat-inducible protein A
MKNILSLLLITILTLSMLNSCASKKNTEVATPKGFTNTRTIRTVNSSTVVCHNCRAKFKLSYRIQKLVHNGNAEVRCPVCHKNYLTGQVVK